MRYCIGVVLTVAAPTSCPESTLCWGDEGHPVVATIALKLLSP